MDRLSRWRRRTRPPSAPSGTDPELGELFARQRGADAGGLLETAEELRRRLSQEPGPKADPCYQRQLRASLVSAAQARGQARRHRLGLLFGTGVGAAGLAMVAVVVFSLVVLPQPARKVRVQAAISGNHRVAVTAAIRLGFNQPMDEAAVDEGLRITPAVSFATSWPDSRTLVISPQNGLAPNVGYVVTIAQSDVRAQSGAQAGAEVVIPFGTGSAPSTPQGIPPSVVSITPDASITGSAAISYGDDYSLLVLSSGELEAISPSQPASSPSPTFAEPSPSASPAAAGGTLYLLNPSPHVVATDALGAACSPDSQEIAYWTPQADGTLGLEVISASGGTPETLATSDGSNPGLAWLDDGDLLYASAGQLHEVSLDGQITSVFPEVRLAPSDFFTLSPSSQQLFTTPAGVPTVYSLTSGTSSPIPGLVGLPAWTLSGSEMGYVDQSGGSAAIELSSDGGVQSTQLLSAPSGVELGGLSFDPTGSYLAYTTTGTGEQAQLELVDVQSQIVGSLGSFAEVGDPVWAPSGDQLSALAEATGSDTVDVYSLLLSGTGESRPAGDAAQDLALSAAASLAQLQVTDSASSQSSINALLAPGASLGSTILLPGRFDRFYAISATPTSSGATTYAVDLRLVRDANDSVGPAYLPELVTVQTAGASPLITVVSQGALTPVPLGPLVLSASASVTSSGAVVVEIQFNSDLNPATVGSESISLEANGQAVPNLEFNYAPLTRTETVTAPSLTPGSLTLTVSAPLADVDGTPMHGTFQVVLQAGSANPG